MNERDQVAGEQCAHPRWKQWLIILTSWSAVGGGIVIAAFFIAACFYRQLQHSWGGIAAEHFPTIIGIPCAAVAALCIVLTLDVVSGHIHLKLWVFTFDGASGPIIMWVICFLAITFAIWLTWPQVRKGGLEPNSQMQSGAPNPPNIPTH
jgi:hypothetical protein